jgi:Spy/CpxP family protein refolding chaperone
LSEEQVATMKEAAETFRAKHKEWGEKMKAAAVEQARLISEPTVDEEAVMKAVEAVGAVHIEMAKLRTRHLLALRGMLTADQREKLRQFADNMRERGPRKPRGDREEEPRRRRPRRGPREEQPAEPPEVF